jgi:nucleotide-binding universal stress UspA family protein
VPTIKHILFPFDFSAAGMSAARYVASVADKEGARVTVLSVAPPPWDIPALGMPTLVGLDPESQKRELQCRLNRVLTTDFAGIQVDRFTAAGDPALQITVFAHANGVDLIMLPTHGCGYFRSLLIGSTTAKVLHDAKCPVWTAVHAEEQRSPVTPKTILCALDGTEETAHVLEWAAAFSRDLNADLVLVHVTPLVTDWIDLPGERDLQEQVRAEGRSKMEALQREAGTHYPLLVAVGPVTETLVEEARRQRADAVIIGRGTLQGAFGRLRTHAYGIVQHSPCPVISI